MSPRKLRRAAWHLEEYAAGIARMHKAGDKWPPGREGRKLEDEHNELLSLARELKEHARARLAAISVKPVE